MSVYPCLLVLQTLIRCTSLLGNIKHWISRHLFYTCLVHLCCCKTNSFLNTDPYSQENFSQLYEYEHDVLSVSIDLHIFLYVHIHIKMALFFIGPRCCCHHSGGWFFFRCDPIASADCVDKPTTKADGKIPLHVEQDQMVFCCL